MTSDLREPVLSAYTPVNMGNRQIQGSGENTRNHACLEIVETKSIVQVEHDDNEDGIIGHAFTHLDSVVHPEGAGVGASLCWHGTYGKNVPDLRFGNGITSCRRQGKGAVPKHQAQPLFIKIIGMSDNAFSVAVLEFFPTTTWTWVIPVRHFLSHHRLVCPLAGIMPGCFGRRAVVHLVAAILNVHF